MDSSGLIQCWGNVGKSVSNPPNQVVYDMDIAEMHGCAVTANPAYGIACWGVDDYGQATPPDTEWESVDSGWYHACAIDILGQMECWGKTTEGKHPSTQRLHISRFPVVTNIPVRLQKAIQCLVLDGTLQHNRHLQVEHSHKYPQDTIILVDSHS